MSCILIAEDERRITAFIDKGLRKYGFSTAIATDGEQAVLMAQSDKFDLLLLDLGLLVKDGWTVLAELRQQGKQLPIIIVTARDDVAEKKVGLQYEANDYLTKPFRFQDLLARVHNHLGSGLMK
ncbi:response regulator with CheY-like receiver domain and winged-helix DNA-binding domain [Pleurocapsa sp. PCC 7327]|uniref:response regulator transcription factor n=1 Tax=Pleurocapsa sp. PCC 7327 TaxID=118163 RepID=UPI00029F9E6E|nr:response regulator [Pleurocapsa sp. PCC 7327]AFY77273.1 response regulator with CheY-like receiver domain and winged-helix DNA-binding domain [Pleurocapsa sp. PCC 7327]